MAGLKDADDFQDGERFQGGARLKRGLLAGGVAGLVVFFLLALFWEEKRGAMAYSWLFAVVYFLTLAVGGLFWTLLHHASNSGWGTVVRRLMEQLSSLIPFLLVLGLPLLLPGFRDALWEWIPKREVALEHAVAAADEEFAAYRAETDEKVAAADGAVVAAEKELAAQKDASPGARQFLADKVEDLRKKADELKAKDLSDEGLRQELVDKHFLHEDALLHAKRAYLNQGAWYFRFFLYAVALTGIAYVLRGWSLRQDRDGDPKWFRWMRRGSCGFLPLFAVSWTFLVFDWLMALDYTWFSTMWGVYLFAGAALNSMGLLIIVLTLLRRAGHLQNVVTMEHYHLMGKLMHAFVIFWAYIAFSQFFLIWYANITEETKFYLERNTDFWNGYSITFLVIGHFFIPFTLLLLQGIKKMPLAISLVAGWNLLMHLFDVYWIIAPERGPSLTAASGEIQMRIPGAWIFDLLAFATVACLFGFFLMRQLGSASLFPCRDPRLDESLNVVN